MQRDFRKDWREYPADKIPSKNKLPDFLFEVLKKQGVKTILDLGCGVGKIAVDLHTRGYSVVGVDINPVVEKAKTIDSPDHFLRFYVKDSEGYYYIPEVSLNSTH